MCKIILVVYCFYDLIYLSFTFLPFSLCLRLTAEIHERPSQKVIVLFPCCLLANFLFHCCLFSSSLKMLAIICVRSFSYMFAFFSFSFFFSFVHVMFVALWSPSPLVASFHAARLMLSVLFLPAHAFPRLVPSWHLLWRHPLCAPLSASGHQSPLVHHCSLSLSLRMLSAFSTRCLRPLHPFSCCILYLLPLSASSSLLVPISVPSDLSLLFSICCNCFMCSPLLAASTSFPCCLLFSSLAPLNRCDYFFPGIKVGNYWAKIYRGTPPQKKQHEWNKMSCVHSAVCCFLFETECVGICACVSWGCVATYITIYTFSIHM